MSRALRIEHEETFYHVMNRGRKIGTVTNGTAVSNSFMDMGLHFSEFRL